MANQEQVERLKRSVDEWNQWRQEYPEIYPDLGGVRFSADGPNSENSPGSLADGGFPPSSSVVEFSHANLSSADLRGADLSFANLRNTDLSHANLRYTNLNHAKLESANLSFANLSFATLKYASLGSAALNNARLDAVILKHANLMNTNLSEAIILGGDFGGALLGGANLSRTEFNEFYNGTTNFNAYLDNANFTEAKLHNVSFIGAKLSGADFTKVGFSSITFGQVDLSHVQGLETVNHRGRSFVDINTVILPHDEQTRLHFLRGVGFTETQIEYLPSRLTPRPIQYHSLFISYAHQDKAIAERLYTDFRKHDIPCWFAPHELVPGDYYHHKIDEAIHTHDKLVLILSEHSIKSQWVEKEVETALKREESIDMTRQVLFPIRLDDTVMTTNRRWISSLRYHRHIGDFTGWQDDAAYQQAFTILLQHLKVSNPPVR